MTSKKVHSITLDLLNENLTLSLVYTLEREFPGVSFTMDPKQSRKLLLVPKDEIIPLDEIRKFVKKFENGVKRIGNRIKPVEVWSLDSRDGSYGKAEFGSLQSNVPGTFFLDQDQLNIVESLDRLFESYAVRVADATKIRVPSIISRRNLERCQYLPKQRHQVTSLFVEDSKDTGMCLTPAACLPLYSALEGRIIYDMEAFTFVSQTYRHEAGIFSNSEWERNWEYPLREVVIFYTKDETEKVLLSFSNFMKMFCRRFLRSARMSTAADTFFHVESANLAIHQLLHSTKYEISYLDSQAKPLAISSLNIHGRSFTKEYSIASSDGSGKAVHSLCIGWGLTRILRSVLESNKVARSEICTEINCLQKEWENGFGK